MDPVIRPGRITDLGALETFTSETFSWGDYVPASFERWLSQDASSVAVAVDEEDVPIALARAVLVSDTEMWLHAARVHPDHRRRGLASAINEHLLDWGRAHRAIVARLLIEDWNEAAQTQVATAGYRPVSAWVWAHRAILDRDPQPTGNGGKRVPGPERLKIAHAVEAESAFLAWSTSSLMRMGRGLFAAGWTWRRLKVDDLATAAKSRTFFESPSGWAMITTEELGAMSVDWMMATPDDTFRLVRAILDRAIETDARNLAFFAPATVETTDAFSRIGCTINGSTIWERGL